MSLKRSHSAYPPQRKWGEIAHPVGPLRHTPTMAGVNPGDEGNWSRYRSDWWTGYFTGDLAQAWPSQLDQSEPDSDGYRWVSRKDVFDIAATKSPHRELRTAVAAYVWGVGFGSRFRKGQLVRAFTTNSDVVEGKLRRAARILAEEGPVAAYGSMLRGGSAWTKFMGPAYFTKFLFFIGYHDPGLSSHGTKEPDPRNPELSYRPLILDRRVATALRERWVFPPGTGNSNWPSDLYRRYLAYCHEQYPSDPEAGEYELFNYGNR